MNIIKARASITILVALFFSSLLFSFLFFSFFLLRLGKHRRDERPQGRMERKSSSKSKAEKKQPSEEEESLRLKLEQER